MSPSTRRAPARLPSHHIDAIDQALAQLRGTLGLLASLGPPQERTDPHIWAEDLLNFCWLLEDHLLLIDRHAQALWQSTRDAQQGGSQ